MSYRNLASYDNWGGKGDRRDKIEVSTNLDIMYGDISDIISGYTFDGYCRIAPQDFSYPDNVRYLKFDFKTLVAITHLTIYLSSDKSIGFCRFYVSNDDRNWTLLNISRVELGKALKGESQIYGGLHFYRFFRIDFEVGSFGNVMMKEIEFKTVTKPCKYLFSMPDGQYYGTHLGKEGGKSIVPFMKSYTSPTGKVIFDTELITTSFLAFNAFDGGEDIMTISNSQYYSKNTYGYIGYEFETPTVVTSYELVGSPMNVNKRNPKTWYFEGSNNGSTWDRLDYRSMSFLGDFLTSSWTINPDKIGYKMYRLRWTANQGETSSGITELKMYSEPHLVPLGTNPTAEMFDIYGLGSLNNMSDKLWSTLKEISPTYNIITLAPPLMQPPSLKEHVFEFPMKFEMNALPQPQFIANTEDFKLHGDLEHVLVNMVPSNVYDGKARFVLSFDGGASWERCVFGKWSLVDVNNLDNIKINGMTKRQIEEIRPEDFKGKSSLVRIGYYLEESKLRDEEVVIDDSRLIIKSAIDGLTVEDMRFYILNTNATINVELQGNKIVGSVEDEDQGRVQYRILLNGSPYYPFDGKFTRFAPAPQGINLIISDEFIKFGEINKLKIEFQDFWGVQDFWETEFIGSYSGLLFTDPTGDFYTTAFGDVLKYLNIGTLVAGQTSLDYRVRIQNKYGYDIKNLYLQVNKEKEPEGVAIELSHKSSPFLAQDRLDYEGVLKDGEEVEFYVRIATDLQAPPNPSGVFELRAKAEKA